MFAYFKDCFIVWLVGFVPMLGIYIAIPVGFFLKLDPLSIALCAIFGTYLPIPLIILFFDWLNSFPRVRMFLMKFYSERFTNMVNNHGMLFILFVSPLIGAWTVSITGRLLHINARRLAIYTFLGMVLYGVLLTALIFFGICFIDPDVRILNFLGRG
jgi:uncharacterized membrane protein